MLELVTLFCELVFSPSIGPISRALYDTRYESPISVFCSLHRSSIPASPSILHLSTRPVRSTIRLQRGAMEKENARAS